MKRFLLSIIMIAEVLVAMAQQEDFEAYRKQMLEGFDAHRDKVLTDYASYRQKINADYAEHMRQAWQEFRAFKGERVPEDDVNPVPPLPYDEKQKDEPVIEQEIAIDSEVTPMPEPKPQPQPIEPIEQQPVGVPLYFTTSYCGTEITVRLSQREKFRLTSLREDCVADAWNALCRDEYGNLLYDCLTWREKLHLCDWAYLGMLSALCNDFLGSNTSEATLLLSWLYCQSGYKMRIGAYPNRLEMLYSSEHRIYDHPYYKVRGENFYPFVGSDDQHLRIFDYAFEGESSMSLLIGPDQMLSAQATKARRITSRDFPQLSVSVQANQSDLTFFDTYPTSELNGNMMTRWAMYANVPLSEVSRQQLYPALRQHIAGMNQHDAANLLLNWVQTGLEYEYDEKVWGGDRAFFAEETLFYPYCDCEDRSILFSRLMHDLLGLDVLLVYYPGHLATAVGFAEDVKGDYIMHQGKKYVVCDPTYIGAPVGRTMPRMDNASAKVILVR